MTHSGKFQWRALRLAEIRNSIYRSLRSVHFLPQCSGKHLRWNQSICSHDVLWIFGITPLYDGILMNPKSTLWSKLRPFIHNNYVFLWGRETNKIVKNLVSRPNYSMYQHATPKALSIKLDRSHVWPVLLHHVAPKSFHLWRAIALFYG